MKHLLRPTQNNFLDKYRVSTRKEYLALDKVWKQIIKEDRERNHVNSDFAPLSILRNQMLRKDMYTGFTPVFNINELKNGKGFMDGFQVAYDRLVRALKNETVTSLRINVCRMLITVHPCPYTLTLANAMLDIGTFNSTWYVKSYVSRVHANVVEQIEQGVDLKGSTYTDLFNMFDSDHIFNVIREKDYRESRFTPEEFQVKLVQFANDWIAIYQKTKEERVSSVVIKSDTDWLYENSDGSDTRNQTDLTDIIVITTKPKFNHISPSLQYYVPVKHLWEVDWLREFMD